MVLLKQQETSSLETKGSAEKPFTTLTRTFKILSDPRYLKDLLVQAGFLGDSQLKDLSAVADTRPERLGQLLILAGLISREDLQLVLDAQAIMRQGRYSRSYVVAALRQARVRRISFHDALNETLQLDKAEAVQVETLPDDDPGAERHADDQEFADPLCQPCQPCQPPPLPTDDVVESPAQPVPLLSLQQVALLPDEDTTSPAPPTVHESEAEAPASDQAKPGRTLPSLIEFAVRCGAVGEEAVAMARMLSAGTDIDLVTALHRTGALRGRKQQLVRLCHDLYEDGQIDFEEAAFTFNYCYRQMAVHDMSMEEATEKLAFRFGLWAPYDRLTKR
jgi:hypothetical protein